MAKERKFERIVRKDGKNCFVEVLDSAFELGKVRLDFISYDTNAAAGSRQTANIGIYVDIDKFLAFADKVRISGKEYTKYCNANPDYKKPFFTSMGGVSSKVLKSRGTPRSDGMGISRTVSLSASKKGYFLTAKSGPGMEDEKGLIVPKYKEPEEKVSIAFDHDTLMELLIMVEMRYQAYLAADYILNPISAREGAQKKQTSSQTATSNNTASKPVETKSTASEFSELTDEDLPF